MSLRSLNNIQTTVIALRQCCGIFALTVLLGACATAPDTRQLDTWVQETQLYSQTLPPNHPDSVASILALPVDIKLKIAEKFGRTYADLAAIKITRWLLSKQGHAMEYDRGANFTPAEAYQERRGNCLSFTLLLVALGDSLGVELQYNEVDLPDAWNLDERVGMVLYRHVNAIYDSPRAHRVFDLAMQSYDYGYPQRIISKEQAVSLLHNNKAMDALIAGDVDRAEHLIKLAISLNPKNPDFWVNYAVLLKRQGRLDMVERSLLHALILEPHSGTVASSLDRLYTQQGRLDNAKKYAKLALRSRRKNPYHHFEIATKQFEEGRYKTAKTSINKAIRLHKEDPKFFAKRSEVYEALVDYKRALEDLKQAIILAKTRAIKLQYRQQALALIDRSDQYYAEQARQSKLGAKTVPATIRGSTF